MRISDLTDIDRVVRSLLKMIGILFALLIAAELICELLARITFLDSFLLFAFFLLASPIAYFIRDRRRPQRPERPHSGAERTPLLPPTEDEE